MSDPSAVLGGRGSASLLAPSVEEAAPLPVTGPAVPQALRAGRLPALVSRRAGQLRAVPHLLTYLGVLCILASFGLLILAWGRIAGTLDVGLQLPYLASAGFTGIALAICGVAMVVVDTRATDARARADQLDELAATLREVRLALEHRSTGVQR